MFPFGRSGIADASLHYGVVEMDPKLLKIVIEPYGGNFSMCQYMFSLKDYTGTFVVNDVNKELIDFYKELKGDPSRVLKNLRSEVYAYTSQNIDEIDPLECSFGLRAMKSRKPTAMLKIIDKAIKRIEYVEQFLNRCEFINSDAIEFMKTVDSYTNALVYIDQPKFSNREYQYDKYQADNSLCLRYDGTALYYYSIKLLQSQKLRVICSFPRHDYFDLLLEQELISTIGNRSIYAN